MVYWRELKSRIEDHFKFSRQENLGLIVAIVVTAFIFNFCGWGPSHSCKVNDFDPAFGLMNMFLVLIIVAVSFYFRIACQKIYALSTGYQAEFKVWWTGLIIAVVIAFITSKLIILIPLILIGGINAVFMVRQRLGEFRYGFSYMENGIIALWGVIGNIIMAIVFAVGAYVFPQSYFFSKGVMLNIIFAICALLPLPQLDGLNIFFGSRIMYVVAIFMVLLSTVLLLTKTDIGLIAVIVIGAIAGIIYLLRGSEK